MITATRRCLWIALALLVAFAAGARAAEPNLYVAGGAVTPVSTATGSLGIPIPVPGDGIVITPDGRTAYVSDPPEHKVTPITLATREIGSAIPAGVGSGCCFTPGFGIAMTPDGSTVYVTNNSAPGIVTAIDVATNTANGQIAVGDFPHEIAVTPNGETAYVVTEAGVTPITLSTGTVGSLIPIAGPRGIAIAPDGKTAYVADYAESGTVTPIDVATNTAETPIPAGPDPDEIAIAPDGKTAYVSNSDVATVTPITLATGTTGTPIQVAGGSADAIAISADGRMAYVASESSGAVTPINLVTDTAGSPISVPDGADNVVIGRALLRTISTSVQCAPDSITVSQSTTCTATVSDVDSGTPSTPSGTVSFSSGDPGAFAPGQCTLVDSGAAASCQVTYSPSSSRDPRRTVSVAYSGDANHSVGSGSAQVKVVPDPPIWTLQDLDRPGGGLSSVACGPVSCMALEQFTPDGAAPFSEGEYWNGRLWSVRAMPSPAGAGATDLGSVSCTIPTSCTAVGGYVDGTGTQRALAAVWNQGGKWRLQATPDRGTLKAVSCPRDGQCIAVGEKLAGGSGPQVTVAETSGGGTWVRMDIPSPTGGLDPTLRDVSCASAAGCLAVGDYVDGSGAVVPLAERWDGSAWTIQTPPNPPPEATATRLRGVSCLTETDCLAVGDYTNAGGSTKPLAEHWNGSSWTILTPLIPAGAADASFAAVSCAPTLACMLVGNTTDAAGNATALSELWQSSGWTVQSLPLPAGASVSGLTSVSCRQVPNCAAVGYFLDESGHQMALAERYASSSPVAPVPG
jgi:YVTN family beta-propeller protein